MLTPQVRLLNLKTKSLCLDEDLVPLITTLRRDDETTRGAHIPPQTNFTPSPAARVFPPPRPESEAASDLALASPRLCRPSIRRCAFSFQELMHEELSARFATDLRTLAVYNNHFHQFPRQSSPVPASIDDMAPSCLSTQPAARRVPTPLLGLCVRQASGPACRPQAAAILPALAPCHVQLIKNPSQLRCGETYDPASGATGSHKSPLNSPGNYLYRRHGSDRDPLQMQRTASLHIHRSASTPAQRSRAYSSRSQQRRFSEV
eukprot:m.196045 g.196045  ORF g.196045 m.196045 type:complete len:262 (-) comp53736_c0_seq4:351-1136(-)